MTKQESGPQFGAACGALFGIVLLILISPGVLGLGIVFWPALRMWWNGITEMGEEFCLAFRGKSTL